MASLAATTVGRPPSEPWRELTFSESGKGCLSVFYSDALSGVPVREVTRPGDNKSDPNIETGTFGLFSTCEKRMRTSVVERGIQYLLFITTPVPGCGRVLAGYYELGWWCSVASDGEKDYCLAARRTHFVEHPVRLATLSGDLGETCRAKFRQYRLLEPRDTMKLVNELDGQPDISSRYVDEVHRLEMFNQRRTGYRYAGWKRSASFDWEAAIPYLEAAALKQGLASNNVSPNGLWQCGSCEGITANRSLLRACPICSAIGTLVPALGESP